MTNHRRTLLKKRKLVKGNEAVAMGAIKANCRFYFGYPITPQNEIPEYLAKHLPKLGGDFIQAESEIAAINMLLGASASGHRAMTSSSSPGISLKQEGISYLAGSELPPCRPFVEIQWKVHTAPRRLELQQQPIQILR